MSGFSIQGISNLLNSIKKLPLWLLSAIFMIGIILRFDSFSIFPRFDRGGLNFGLLIAVALIISKMKRNFRKMR